MEEELNKAAEQYASDNAPDYPDVSWEDTYDAAKLAFIAGAIRAHRKSLLHTESYG